MHKIIDVLLGSKGKNPLVDIDTQNATKERMYSESNPEAYSESRCEPPKNISSEDENVNAKYRVVNKDTGEIMDIRSIEQSMPNYLYNQPFSSSSMSEYTSSRELAAEKGNPDGDADSDTETILTEQSTRGKNSTTTSKGSGIFSFFRSGSKAKSNVPSTTNTNAQQSSNTQDNSKEDPISFVKVTTVKKDISEFDDLKQIQMMNIHNGPIWTVKFSPDGMYMGSAGQDTRVVVWKVGHVRETDNINLDTQKSSSVADEAEAIISNCTENNNRQSTYSTANTSIPLPEPIPSSPIPSQIDNTLSSNRKPYHRQQLSTSSMNSIGIDSLPPPPIQCPTSPSPNDIILKFGFIDPEPFRIYVGHTGDVIDIAWSKSIFLLSASIDKTVRLWHVSR